MTNTLHSGITRRRFMRSEEHTSELQSRSDLVCRLLLEKKNNPTRSADPNTQKNPKQNTNILLNFARGSHRAAEAQLPGVAQALGQLPGFFFNDTATTEIYTLSLHDALPIFLGGKCAVQHRHPDRSEHAAAGPLQ